MVVSPQRAVRLIDTDVHQSLPGLHDHLPRHWRDRWSAVGLGAGSGYLNPRGVLRRDAVPPTGGGPASDPVFLLRDHLDRYDIDYAILTGPFVLPLGTDPDYLNAIATAVNDATLEDWLSVSPRLRGSILINSDDPSAAVQEIERLAERPEMAQVVMASTTRQPCGQRRYLAIYETAARYGLPVAIHPGAEGAGSAAPPTPVGYPSRYLEWHTMLPLTAMAQVASLVCEGVFEQLPSLRVVVTEGGLSWLPHLMWRLDKNFMALRDTVPWLTRRPSDYIKDHIRLTTQPVEEPQQPDHLGQILAMMAGERTVMFSSDYPHWDNDNPDRLFRRLDHDLRARIMAGTAGELYGFDQPPDRSPLAEVRSVKSPTAHHLPADQAE